MYAVEIAPRARRELLRLAAWWQEHSGRPRLVADELEEALRALAVLPEIGAPYPFTKRTGVRRWLLRRIQVHVYYRVLDAEQVVRIAAFWHTARGRAPRI